MTIKEDISLNHWKRKNVLQAIIDYNWFWCYNYKDDLIIELIDNLVFIPFEGWGKVINDSTLSQKIKDDIFYDWKYWKERV